MDQVAPEAPARSARGAAPYRRGSRLAERRARRSATCSPCRSGRIRPRELRRLPLAAADSNRRPLSPSRAFRRRGLRSRLLPDRSRNHHSRAARVPLDDGRSSHATAADRDGRSGSGSGEAYRRRRRIRRRRAICRLAAADPLTRRAGEDRRRRRVEEETRVAALRTAVELRRLTAFFFVRRRLALRRPPRAPEVLDSIHCAAGVCCP